MTKYIAGERFYNNAENSNAKIKDFGMINFLSKLSMVVNLFLIIIFTGFSLPSYSWSWKHLWQTPDQQGQVLMQKKQFAEAEDTFSDLAWSAAAAYRAGHYEEAAQKYSQLHNEQSYYNQGNSFAHMQKYEDAINAYRQTLAINPNHEDAKYNLELIKQLLKQQQSKQQQKEQQQSQKTAENQKSRQDGHDSTNSLDKENNTKEQNKGSTARKQQQDLDQSKQNEGKEKSNNSDQSKAAAQNPDRQKSQDKNRNLAQEKEPGLNKSSTEDPKKLSSKKAQSQENEAIDRLAEQEKQQAKAQWLKLIPDDPAGLMRALFLRDHLRRQ